MDTNNRFTKEKEQELIERLKEPYIYYADYRDQIEDTFIKELAKDIENDPNTPPITLFKEKIWECYEDAEYPEQQSYAADIGLDYKNLSEEDQERFDEVFMEHIYCEPDYDHFLSQNICINIIIDSGDYNWDLGCNQVYPHYDGDYDYNKRHGIPDDSCITWLAKKTRIQQNSDKKCTPGQNVLQQPIPEITQGRTPELYKPYEHISLFETDDYSGMAGSIRKR